MKSLAAIIFAGLVALGGLYAAATASAQPSKLFVVGQQYSVLYSCISSVGCYGEVVTVREVRADGWLVVTTEDNRRWTVNSALILSFMPIDERRAEP